MSMQPPQPPTVSVMEPFSQAFEVAGASLFRPFNLKRWATLGLLAFLTNMTSCNAGSNFNIPGGGGGGGGGGSLQQEAQRMLDFVNQYMIWIIPGVIVVLLIGFGFTALFTWLGTRSRFAFVDNIARDDDALEQPWKEFAREGNSFFMLHLAINGVYFLFSIVLLGFAYPVLQSFAETGELGQSLIALLVLGGLILFALSIGLSLFAFFVNHFALPVAYARRLTVKPAMAEAWGLMRSNIGKAFGYLGLMILVSIAAGVIFGIASCVAMLCLCVLACIPFVAGYGATLLTLPVWYYKQAIPLLFMQQFGPQYQIFQYPDQGMELLEGSYPMPPGAIPPPEQGPPPPPQQGVNWLEPPPPPPAPPGPPPPDAPPGPPPPDLPPDERR